MRNSSSFWIFSLLSILAMLGAIGVTGRFTLERELYHAFQGSDEIRVYNHELPRLAVALPDLSGRQHLTVHFRAAGEALSPHIAQFSKLERLTIEGNLGHDLRALQGMHQLKRLCIVDLWDDHLLSTLDSLYTLQSLAIHRCGLRTLPANLARFTQLQALDLQENELDWSEEYPFPILPKLRTLNLSYNRLTRLPLELFRQPALRQLLLKNNQTGLEDADIAGAQMQAVKAPDPLLEADNTVLEELDLSNNQVRVFPSVVMQCTHLRTLNLSDNQLSEELPSLEPLLQLETIDLSYNGLTVLPEDWRGLSQLQTLNLSNNQLSKLPKDLAKLTNLEYLYLQNNQLQRLPSDLAVLPKLQVLSADDDRSQAE